MAREDFLEDFPDTTEILRYIEDSPTPVDKRDIARAFELKGAQRRRLREVLLELQEQGKLEDKGKKKLAPPDRLPPVGVVEVVGLDEDGELIAKPANWAEEDSGPPPRIYLSAGRSSRAALAVGDQALAKLARVEDGVYEGKVIRRIGRSPRRVLGLYEMTSQGGRLRPTDKRAKQDYVLNPPDAAGAKPGELVLAEVKSYHPRMGLRDVRVVERLGSLDNQRALSLVAIHEHGLRTAFPEEAEAEAEAAVTVGAKGRDNLRDIPLVTIDGADARDFDDAVYAEPDDEAKNHGGWRLLVAIADVAHYVQPDSALDREARARGNSAYFPDRVVPMLPEALSNGWCSLRPKEDRGCLAVWMTIDAEGELMAWRFLRGVMRSAARLTYEQVQAAMDGAPDDTSGPLLDPVIRPLYGAFQALLTNRRNRGTLELDMPERRILLNDEGDVAGIEPRQRLDSHRVIEELMICANVAAAGELERLRQPCMYRVHDLPDPQKVDALREVLDGMGIRLAKGQVIRPKTFKRVLEQAVGTPHANMVSELVLRCQSQAVYSPENLGHFGLALQRYAHFTSPIRRYADLLVHRALIRGLKLGGDGLTEAQATQFKAIGEQISMTERAAMAAERDAVDRMTAAFLSDRVGATFEGRVNGVTRFGLFVTLIESGADGLIPISSLPDDFYVHDERQHCLVGRRWGRRYRLGELLPVRLVEADRTTGGLVLHLADPDHAEDTEKQPSSGHHKAKNSSEKKTPSNLKTKQSSDRKDRKRTPQARRSRVRRSR
ncbi:ribonuclease R [Algihabitans albus]|uniref:ribonuclease R n=1 Tax=Algihabitans albus TaxID=2164067 RepID=UPI000E5D6104|nr:ribonuclease R [Algihabitans albus]